MIPTIDMVLQIFLFINVYCILKIVPVFFERIENLFIFVLPKHSYVKNGFT